MDKKEIEVEDKKIFYRVIGSGQPVVLIHGFGEHGDVWKNQVPIIDYRNGYRQAITENDTIFRFIVPDLPGSGKSEMVDDMSMEGLSEVIKKLLDREKIHSCIMIGHSMGGYVTLAFADRYPELLKGLGLFHSTAYADTEEKKAARRKGIEFINDHGAFEFLRNTTPNLFSPASRDEQPIIVDELIDSLSNFSAGALVSYYEGMIRRSDKTMILRNSTIPVLFIAGNADNAVPLDDILKQCHLPSLSYIHILNKSGHMGMLEEPAKANLILKRFLLDAMAI